MKITHINGGATCVDFNDSYDTPCSLQESLGAETPHIWLGANSATHPQRMLLSQDQVRELLPRLSNFAEFGALDYSGMYVKNNGLMEDGCTSHPQWAAWLAWYMANYTTHVPLHGGEPATMDTALSWETWKASHTKAQPLQWMPFSVKRPPDNARIIFRKADDAEDIGIGYYCEEDADGWHDDEQWIHYDDLFALEAAK